MSPTSTSSLVSLEQVTLTVGSCTLLKNVSLALEPAEIVSIVGPNGAGKTTLAKVIVGLLAPQKGRVVRKKGATLGYMPQKMRIEPSFPLTVERFLRLGQRCTKAELVKSLQEVGVESVLNTPLQAISGGEFQRVLLARALLRRPQLLVLDEPAQGVDLMGQGEFYDLISKIRETHHCAILLISHDLNIVMAKTDQVVCLNQHVCCSGSPEAVSQDPEFEALFGRTAKGLAFYTHRHDHQHDVRGDIVGPDKEKT